VTTNRYGLDANYFREKLTLIARDCDSFTPYEMYLALTRLADVVQESMPVPVQKYVREIAQ
jgi:hypothetical protein